MLWSFGLEITGIAFFLCWYFRRELTDAGPRFDMQRVKAIALGFHGPRVFVSFFSVVTTAGACAFIKHSITALLGKSLMRGFQGGPWVGAC